MYVLCMSSVITPTFVDFFHWNFLTICIEILVLYITRQSVTLLKNFPVARLF